MITGIGEGGYVVNLIAEAKGSVRFQKTRRVGRERPGTGDIFSAILAASMIRREEIETAVKRASGFVKACILKSEEQEIPVNDGVCLEEMLFMLMK